jgi:hypothetical protein
VGALHGVDDHRAVVGMHPPHRVGGVRFRCGGSGSSWLQAGEQPVTRRPVALALHVVVIDVGDANRLLQAFLAQRQPLLRQLARGDVAHNACAATICPEASRIGCTMAEPARMPVHL